MESVELCYMVSSIAATVARRYVHKFFRMPIKVDIALIEWQLIYFLENHLI